VQRLHFLYHELRTEESQYSYVVRASEFEKQMALFQSRQTENPAALLPKVTFDDGHLSDFTVALPILQAKGMQARFFITAGWTGQRAGYMGWPELRELHAAGQAIGAHGWSHTLLTHCDANQLRHELQDARIQLENGLGDVVETMSLPGGRYDQKVLAACREAGYRQIFTSIPKAETVAEDFLVGRLNVVGGMSLEWIEGVLDSKSTVLTRLERQYKVKAFAKGLLGDSLYARLWSLVNRSEPQMGEEA